MSRHASDSTSIVPSIDRRAGACGLLVLLCLLVSGVPAQAAKLPYFNFGSAGTLGGQFAAGANNGPTGSAVNVNGIGPGASAGDLYVVDRASNRVEQFHANGAFVRAFGANVGGAAVNVCTVAASCAAGTASNAAGGMTTPQGVAVDPATGNVFVTDQGNRRVDVFGADGSFQGAFGWGVDTGAAAFEFCTAASTCQAPAAAGGAAGQFGTQMGYPAVDPTTGNLFVANATNRRVDQFSFTLNAGKEVTAAAFVSAFGWGVDTNANEFQVCTTVSTCNTASTVGGANVGQFGPGGLAVNPQRVAVDSTGAVYTVESVSNFRVQKFVPTGTGGFTPSVFGLPKANEVQTVTVKATAGQFTLKFGANTTGSLPFNATAVEVETALNALTSIKSGAGSVTVSGGPGDATGSTPYVVTFSGGERRESDVAQLIGGSGGTPLSGGIGGGANQAAVATTINGSPNGGASANTPTDIAIGPADHVFVSRAFEAGKGSPPAPAPERRILEYSPAGELLDTHMAGAAINSVNGISLDSSTGHPTSGRLYISSTTADQRVYVFTDAPSHPPTVTTGGTSAGLNEFLLTLEGSVNPADFKVKDCHFEYGPTTEYGLTAPCAPMAEALGEGATAVPVSAQAELEELPPSTTIHYRLAASNLTQTVSGADREFTTGPAPADHCPNAGLRDGLELSAILLPDCMALEMVSPPVKAGQPAKLAGQGYEGSVSANGGRVIFRSTAGLGGSPGPLLLGGDPYVATRSDSGWATSSTSPPAPVVRGWEGSGALATSFTPDFSHWFQIASTQTQYQVGISQAFQGGLGGLFSPLSPVITPVTEGEKNDVQQARFRGASADHSHLFFTPGPGTSSTTTALLPGDPEPNGTGADHNTYVAYLDSSGQPSLELVARDRTGKVWGGSCGTRLGGIRALPEAEATGLRNQGSVSESGARVYLSTRPAQPLGGSCSTANKLRILERLESQQGPWIGELFSSECDRAAPPCSSADGNDYYQGASADGSKVYFTTSRQLANSDVDPVDNECSATIGASEGCDLYLYDQALPPGQRLIQVSVGGAGDPTPGAGANVLNGVTAVSGDGSHVYFVAQGILTGENAEHKSPSSGQPNLYVWDRESEAASFIGSLDPGDNGHLWGAKTGGIQAVPELGAGGKGGGDGHILPFDSTAELTADDTDGTHLDVFRYDADTETLRRISKAAPGGSDNGSVDVAGGDNPSSLGTDFAETGRTVSEDGNTVLFTTSQGLIPGDVNESTDYYMWRDGALYRLPGSPYFSGSLAPGIGMSHDGSTVAFNTPTALLGRDGDTAGDVYVARAGGGFAEPTPSSVCSPPGCQPAAPPPPASPNAKSEAPTSGNVTSPPSSCRKGFVRRHGRCVKSKRRHGRHPKHARGSHHVRDANNHRRAAK